MKSINEYIISEGYTLEDMDKVAKQVADFRKKNPDGSIQSMIGILCSSLYQFLDRKDQDDLKKLLKTLERVD